MAPKTDQLCNQGRHLTPRADTATESGANYAERQTARTEQVELPMHTNTAGVSEAGSCAGEQQLPNPGSDAARAIGCTCPVIDNGHGRGDGPFWVRGNCPVHGRE